jgi:hypothetical protein
MKRASIGILLGLATAVVGLTLLTPAPAIAVTFDFSYFSTNTPGLSGSGEFTATSLGGGEYQLTGITGFGGNNDIAITSLSSYAAADNILFYPTQPFVDFGGISFNTADGDAWNIYWNGYYGVLDFNTNPVGYPNSVTIDFSVTETPLPAALPLFAGGLAAWGLFARQRKRKVAAMAAA